MGSAESVPTTQAQGGRRVIAYPNHSPAASLNEKFDAFKLTEDRETDSVLIEKADESHGSSSERNPHVSATKTQQYVKELLADPKNRLALSALSTNNPAQILEIPSAILRDTQTFNIAIPSEGSPITNQRSSGRCWIFAATNVFRIAIMKAHNLASFELSQSYLFFWDKVEKANYFLETILDTASEDLDGRLISTLMQAPVGDGGQWDMIANLVSKYGLVPQTLYPDTWNAQNSSTMDGLLTTLLRENALKLRKLKSSSASSSTISAAKDKMMKDVIRILTLTLGPPPPANEPFTWTYYDKSHKLHTSTLSPLDLAASLTPSRTTRPSIPILTSLISLVNDPRHPYNRLLTVDYLGNIYDGRPVTYINVSQPVLKRAAIAMLKRGDPVFFGSDVGQFADFKKGIMDTSLIDYELGFNVRLGLDKAERLRTGESAMTHAMVLTAVQVDEKTGKSVRWRVENSWSDGVGEKGYFVMSDGWMDEFCYQAVVDKAVVSKEVRDVLGQEALRLKRWDPMGALA